MGTTRKRRQFTLDYRREAAHLVIDTGRTIAAVAAELNVGAALLGRWVRQERAAMGPAGAEPLSEGERHELDRLRLEVAGLRRDNEFLGKASAYFAARQQPSSGSS
jgi:transposase